MKKHLHADAADTANSATPARESPPASEPPTSNDRERYELIARRAYFLAEHRGFAPGGELDDWLAAERMVDNGDLDASAIAKN